MDPAISTYLFISIGYPARLLNSWFSCAMQALITVLISKGHHIQLATGLDVDPQGIVQYIAFQKP